jgi:hypothetical protein
MQSRTRMCWRSWIDFDPAENGLNPSSPFPIGIKINTLPVGNQRRVKPLVRQEQDPYLPVDNARQLFNQILSFGEQFPNRQTLAVFGGVERAALDVKRRLGRDTHGGEDSRMQIGNADRVFGDE